MNILITGATGHVGSKSVDALQKLGHNIRAQVRPVTEQKQSKEKAATIEQFKQWGVEICPVDLSDKDAMEKLVIDMDYILHFAAMVPRGTPSAYTFLDLNVGATIALLEGVRKYNSNLKRFIFSSSCTLYDFAGWNKELITAESRFDNPAGMYRASKKSAEIMVNSYREQHGIPAVILVFPKILFGKELLGDPRPQLSPYIKDRIKLIEDDKNCIDKKSVLTELKTALDNGKELVIPLGEDGTPLRQNLGDIRDIVKACILTCEGEGGIAEPIVIMSDSFEYAKGIPHLSKLSGMSYAKIKIPNSDSYWFDTTAAENILGFKPEHNSISMIEDAWNLNK